jgi:hypothetical protein
MRESKRNRVSKLDLYEPNNLRGLSFFHQLNSLIGRLSAFRADHPKIGLKVNDIYRKFIEIRNQVPIPDFLKANRNAHL